MVEAAIKDIRDAWGTDMPFADLAEQSIREEDEGRRQDLMKQALIGVLERQGRVMKTSG